MTSKYHNRIPDSIYPKIRDYIEENKVSVQAAAKHFKISERSCANGFRRLGIKPNYYRKKGTSGQLYKNKHAENKEPFFSLSVAKKYQSMRIM